MNGKAYNDTSNALLPNSTLYSHAFVIGCEVYWHTNNNRQHTTTTMAHDGWKTRMKIHRLSNRVRGLCRAKDDPRLNESFVKPAYFYSIN